jgi:RNA polymerase-binding protein DksA
MNKIEQKKFRQRLEKERESLISEISRLEKDCLYKSQREASGDLSGYSFHMADVGTDNFTRDFNLELATVEQKILYEVEKALERLDKEEFGICQQCKKKINHERLDAIPYARMCINCEEEKKEDKLKTED